MFGAVIVCIFALLMGFFLVPGASKGFLGFRYEHLKGNNKTRETSDIFRQIKKDGKIEENIYVMTPEERRAAGITDLPSTLHNALKALTEDEVVKAALGEHIYTSFLEAKRIEWAGS